MDVETLVWVAYLETVAEAGGRLSRRDLQALRLHREAVQAAAERALAYDSDPELPGQLRLFGE